MQTKGKKTRKNRCKGGGTTPYNVDFKYDVREYFLKFF